MNQKKQESLTMKRWILLGAVVALSVSLSCNLLKMVVEGSQPTVVVVVEPTLTPVQPTATEELPTETPVPVIPDEPDIPEPEPTEEIPSDLLREIDVMEMVFVPAGEFQIGSSEAQVTDALNACENTPGTVPGECVLSDFEAQYPDRTVYLDAFWIDKTEVTNAMYASCVQAGACTLPNDDRSASREDYYDNPLYDFYPVIHVNWEQAVTYCQWAGARLPTETEWEKAARGTDGRIYPWGDEFDGTRLNFCDINCDAERADTIWDDGYDDTAPAGSYPDGASPYGALDMAGNVWEWVADWFDPTYFLISPDKNPPGPPFGDPRSIRGGSFSNTEWFGIRCAFRIGIDPETSSAYRGFRCAAPEAGLYAPGIIQRPDAPAGGPTPPGLAPPQSQPPLLILDQNYNCRVGPGSGFEVKNSYQAGTKMPIIGRIGSSYWLVSIDEAWSRCKCCFIGGGNPEGDLTGVPEVAPAIQSCCPGQ